MRAVASQLAPPSGLRAAFGFILARSAWLPASVLALILCCARDLLYPHRPMQLPFVGYLLALCVAIGLLHGVLVSLTLWLVSRLPRRAAMLLWTVASFVAFGWLAHVLGGFSRLNSRYSKLAVMVLAGCTAGAVATSVLLNALSPTRDHPEGYLLSRARLWQLLTATLLMAGCVGLHVADLRVFPEQYPVAHTAFRLGAWWLLMIVLVVVLRSTLPASGTLGWLVAAASFGVCLVLLDERRVVSLNAFVTHPWALGVLQTSRSLVDFDRDGHAAYFGASDCEPWNPRIHPGAHEIPDNGIDENCVMGDAHVSKRDFTPQEAPKEPAPMDVVLITIDALNPGHMGVYNPEHYGPSARNTTPNLDNWARESTVFERAYTPGGWTSVAVPALLRGVYARKLQWKKFYETNRFALVPEKTQLPEGEERLHMFPLAFGDPHPTIAELAKQRGMRTLAVTDDGYSAMLKRGTGIERGFDSYYQIDSLREPKRNDAGTADYAISMMRGIGKDKRFFMWVHFFGTHWPDERHDNVRDYGKRPVDLYDHEVAYLDTQVIRLLDAIAAREHPTAIFVAADHGEGVNSISRYHGDTLDEPVIRIPLLARVPGWPAGRVSQLVSSIDILPSVLGLLGSPLPDYLDGIDLAPYVFRTQEAKQRVLFSDTWRYTFDSKRQIDSSAVFDGARKYILDRLTGSLYYESQAGLPKIGTTRWPARLVGTAPFDALSGAVFAYLEEAGSLNIQE
jgi:arylsulfatase A-like enzyme